MHLPLVSVIIPSYNHAPYIEATVGSVLGQTYQNLELFVIDDGSKDDSAARISRLLAARNDSRATLIARKNRGLCRTLNEGLQLARGTYFAYLGSDDLWEPEKVEWQVKAIEAARDERVGAAFGDCYVIDSEGQRLDRYGRQYNYRGGDIYRDLLLMDFLPPSPTNFFVREKLLEVGGFNEDVKIEDYEAWLRVARRFHVAYVPEVVASFRVHPTNTSSNYPERMLDANCHALRLAFDADPTLPRWLQRHAIARQHAGVATVHYNALDLRRARREAFKSLALYPLEGRAWRVMLGSLLGASVVNRLRERRRTSLVYEERG
ncbi:MAG TPA: glycosyltransferase [Pyrinomonadaceae bacterium]|nr:glycosyltransferase [Pyrinomonadaceae bacterium]